jgi:hypothetical protein|tara:strand:- start:57 stop:260 length:204 start_codon:yes stop_codon:yes gene_type:complete
MVLYPESLLIMLYSIYLKHQAKTGDSLMDLEEFRLMFEEQQEAIAKLLEEEVTGSKSKEDTEEEIWH